MREQYEGNTLKMVFIVLEDSAEVVYRRRQRRMWTKLEKILAMRDRLVSAPTSNIVYAVHLATNSWLHYIPLSSYFSGILLQKPLPQLVNKGLENNDQIRMANFSPHLLGYSRMGMELTKGEVGWREQSDFGMGFEGERGFAPVVVCSAGLEEGYFRKLGH
ncbi:MAG: hypothetical protein NXY57DRAFT_1044295 [Lentinula lateritia]|nr:MAG: hypothetical protein NXY57DRAFT_1044295 [Lentinula lateritia]